jgi:calcium-dependent protein kinase
MDSIKIFNKKINDSQKRVESSQVSTNMRFGSLKNVDEKLRAIPNLKYTGSNNIYNSGKFESLKFGIKINDFNCSKLLERNKTNLNNIIYSSPEALSNNESKDNSDIWDCGIIMFYLLSGIFPYSGENEEVLKKKIKLGKFIFDFDKFNGVSEDAKDFMKKCLRTDSNRRITVIEAMSHPFFDDLKDSKVYLEDEKRILENLKNQKERPIFYQMVLTFISYHFNDKPLLQELSRIFYKIDRNTDGKITKEDLLNAYEEAGEKINENELEEIINMVDFDKNGFIEYQEFIRVCIPEDRLFTDLNLKNAFDLFDTEKKGSITHMQVVEALEREDKINSKMIELLKKEVTNMGSESLDLDKFKDLMVNLSLK